MDHDAAIKLLGAYALDACDQAETSEIDAHLFGCELCQREIGEIHSVSGWLGVTEIATPPEWLRAEILREAAKDKSSPVERRGAVTDRRAATPTHPGLVPAPTTVHRYHERGMVDPWLSGGGRLR